MFFCPVKKGNFDYYIKAINGLTGEPMLFCPLCIKPRNSLHVYVTEETTGLLSSSDNLPCDHNHARRFSNQTPTTGDVKMPMQFIKGKYYTDKELYDAIKPEQLCELKRQCIQQRNTIHDLHNILDHLEKRLAEETRYSNILFVVTVLSTLVAITLSAVAL